MSTVVMSFVLLMDNPKQRHFHLLVHKKSLDAFFMLYNILQKRGVMLDSFLFFQRGHGDCKNNNSQGGLVVRQWVQE